MLRLAVWAACVLSASALRAGDYFEIEVVDEATGRGVPLVELSTTNHLRYVTDSAGRVAFFEPDLMEREVFFAIKSHGYEYPADGFGMRGARLTPKAGERATLKIKRTNIAERLYRITGEGLYRDTILLGHPPPLERNGLPGEVMGQDSVQTAHYQGKLYWFYGDTTLAHYPLGIFRMAGATTPLVGKAFDPERGVPLNYFVDDRGRARNMMPLAGEKDSKEGVVWIDGIAVVPDKDGRERMVCHFQRLKGLGDPIEHGMGVWNDEQQVFERATTLKLGDWRTTAGAPIVYKDGDTTYLYCGLMYRHVRVPAKLEAVLDAEQYEALAPDLDQIVSDAVVPPLKLSWRKDGLPFTLRDDKAHRLRSSKMFQPRSVDRHEPISLHGGTVRWNAFRQKWIAIGVQQAGTSYLGEVWYSEADAPIGPWKKAIKIISHDKYSFYNPAHHDFLDADGGRTIYVEGTYTHAFSGQDMPTPRYDYNQVMYRLRLDDERLKAVRK